MTQRSKSKTTSTKKVKVVGTETYLNQQTGEIVPMQVIQMEDRDFNFTKIWMQNIINSIDLIGNQKTRLAFWIIEHLNRENQLIMTFRTIAEQSGISIDTVKKTMKALQQANFLKKQQAGVYVVNPDMLYKGTHNNRMRILLDYTKLDDDSAAEPSDNPAPIAEAAADATKTPDKSILSKSEKPETVICPACGEEISPHEYHDQRIGHESEICYECPVCGMDITDFMKGEKSA